MSNRSNAELNGVTLLGNQNTKYKYEYDPDVLETFINKHPDNDYIVSFDAYEFTSKCVTGDTMIDVACDETKYPDGIPIKDLVGTEGYVFGVDDTTLKPVCRRYKGVRKTGEQVPVVKIVMDSIKGLASNGTFRHEISYIRCTSDHMLLVKEGFHDCEWVRASELKPGMRLIADQRTGDTIRSTSRHRLIGEAIFDEDLLTIHHIDHNHHNNNPDNLANLSTSEHHRLHRSEEYGYDQTLDIETLVQLYNAGENFNSLAKLYNCDSSTIESRIRSLVDVRTQSESLQMKMDIQNKQRDDEICNLYEKGYLLSEIGSYVGLHPTRVSEIIKRGGIPIRESNFARYNRRKLDLPPLNHKVVQVIDDGVDDVYNMEVEDVHNFFGNGVILHNCPKTGQPDFAKIVINYIPRNLMVESKSLKLYLFSFRNNGDFHEDCINMIGKDLVKLMEPKYLEVRGIFSPRGGISIFPYFNYVGDSKYEEFAVQRKLDVMRDSANRTVRYDM